MPVFPRLKLTYFDAEARAEAIRMAFFIGEVPFEDERLAWSDFLARKESFAYGKVPVLYVNGEQIAESQGILRYAARLAGMYPVNDAIAAVLIDEILATFYEMLENLLMPTFVESDADKKKKLLEDMMAGPLPETLAQIEARLQHIASYKAFHGSKHEQIFIHELVVWDYVNMFKAGALDVIPASVTDKYETMSAMYAKVAAHPRVKRWLELKKANKPKHVKLTYFDMEGRAEHIRLALHIGGIKFEDERLSYGELAKRKADLTYGKLPVLEVDGVVFAQSLAILRYAGTMAGMYPTNDPVLACKIDEVFGLFDDLNEAIGKSFANDPAKVKELRDKLAKETIPTVLKGLEKRVALWKKEDLYTMGKDITIADLVIHRMVQLLRSGILDHIPTTIVDSYVNIVAVDAAVSKHPRVLDWYESRKQAKP